MLASKRTGRGRRNGLLATVGALALLAPMAASAQSSLVTR